MSQRSENRRMQSSGYVGKKKHRRIPSRVLAPLLVLVALAAALWVLSLVLQRYMVYSRDGGTMVLPETVVLRTDPPAESDGGAVTDLAVTEEVAALPEGALLAVELSVDDLLAGRTEEILARTGGNAVILDMKPATGVLNWPSDVTLGSQPDGKRTAEPSEEEDEDAVPDPEGEDEVPEEEPTGIRPYISDRAEEIASAVAGLRRQGVVLIARVSLFRDETLARRGAPALSADVYAWLDPTDREVQTYLCDLAEELAAMGFSDLLLCNVGYPEDWDAAPDDRTRAVLAQRMLEDLADAAGRAQLGIAVQPDEAGGDILPVAGLDADALLDCGLRLWCDGSFTWGAASVFSEEALADGRVALGVDRFSAGAGSPVQVIFLS